MDKTLYGATGWQNKSRCTADKTRKNNRNTPCDISIEDGHQTKMTYQMRHGSKQMNNLSKKKKYNKPNLERGGDASQVEKRNNNPDFEKR